MAEGFVTAGSGTVFLGVERSLTGQVWRDRLDDTARAQALAMVQDWALPDLVARILAGRGVMAHEAQLFLEPRMRDLMPDPLGLRDMDRVVERLVRAVQTRETVGIFGDYDVDGACSTALLAEGLSATGLVCRTHIPDRLTEGYGPNTEALQGLIAQGAGLIVTVDCGVTSHEVITAIAGSGTDVLVLDHHQAPEILPPAYGVVDPNRMDDLSGLGHLCAAGVVFLTLVALYRALRADGFWTPQRPEPDLRSHLDLVALATVADVVPLRGLNRAFVRQGLQIMRQRQRIGLRALIDAVRLNGPVEAWHLGYLLGPRINAGGRIGDAGLGVRLLLTQDTAEAERIALQLDALNRDRQVIEASMVDEGEAAALKQVGIHEDLGAVIVTSGLSWHPGVVGLVAARLKERFSRPAFALALDEAGLATGSGRSITGVDLGRVVRKAVEDGLLLRGGGHAMAAGVTLRQEQIEAFTAYLEQELGPAVTKARADQGLWIDAAVTAAGATVPVLHAIEQAGPYGSAYPDPCFVLPAHRLTQVSEVQGGHLRLVLRAGDGSTIKGMAFRVAGKPLGQALLDQRNQTIHVAGRLSIDRYGGGEKAQIQVSDIAKPV
jgi:single-stranded-DNA-specific exonuclease